jgi:hypothetical protein
MYRHTQIGWGIILILGSLTILIYFTNLGDNVSIFTSTVLLLAIAMFSKLTVTVDQTYVRLIFGLFGFPRRKFKLTAVESCRPVKHLSFAISLGIHFGFKQSLYNVSGPHAVALLMKNERKVNIGTDEPEKLSRVIEEELKNNR